MVEGKVSDVGPRMAQLRKSKGLTQDQLGEALGLDKSQISKIESGTRRIDISEVVKAAEALGVATSEILGVAMRDKLALAARVAFNMDIDDLRAMRQRARQIIEVDHVLSEVVGLRRPERSHVVNSLMLEGRQIQSRNVRATAALQAQGEEMAKSVRVQIKLGEAPISDMPELIESEFGVDVALYPFGSSEDSHKPDGLFVHSGDTHIIVANTQFSTGHVRFTLAHELAHFVFADARDIISETTSDMYMNDPAELRANAFAAALLMPEDGVRGTLSRIEGRSAATPAAIRYLMVHFNVSLAALIYRLNVLRLLSFDEGQAIKRRGLRSLPDFLTGPTRDEGSVARPPSRLVTAALSAVAEQRIGLAPLATLLQRDDDEAFYQEVMSQIESGPSSTPTSVD